MSRCFSVRQKFRLLASKHTSACPSPPLFKIRAKTCVFFDFIGVLTDPREAKRGKVSRIEGEKIGHSVPVALVRSRGLEPPRPFGQWLLRPSRLPVPPRPHSEEYTPLVGQLVSSAPASPFPLGGISLGSGIANRYINWVPRLPY